jgi:uncharacterized protein (TIGR00251 family)
MHRSASKEAVTAPSGRARSEPGTRLTVQVQPRASRNGIVAVDGTALRVRVTAPPADGAANQAVRDLLAEALGCPRSAVTILRGHGARTKLVGITGLAPGEIRSRLGAIGP